MGYIGNTGKPQTLCPRCGKVMPMRDFTPRHPYKCFGCGAWYKYRLKAHAYFSDRYGKWVSWGDGYPSDGATGAHDLYSLSWQVHDVLCDRGEWDDCTPLTNWQASMTLHDILLHEGHRLLAVLWMRATLWFGGGKARDNGMFWLTAEAKERYGLE